MREFSIEEKAQRYDEALGKARIYYDEYKTRDNILYVEDMEDMFPELKESEDGRVLRALREGFRVLHKDDEWYSGITNGQIIAWLEKQVEQKPVISDDALREGIAHFGITQYQIDNWLKKYIDVEKQDEQNQKHFELKAGHWYICYRSYCCRADNITVKEGEKFRCEKDGIVKGFVIKEPEKYFKECSAPASMEEEQKPADKVEPRFHEGDKIHCKLDGRTFVIKEVDLENGAYRYTENGRGNSIDYADEMFELVSDWSEEDENLYIICSNLMSGSDGEYADYLKKEAINWFKSLKDRIIPQPKQEWSEEDKWKFYDILALLRGGENCHYNTPELFDWLKSLRPQNRWKPSKEQMETLQYACGGNYVNLGILESLYQDLKKLREE